MLWEVPDFFFFSVSQAEVWVVWKLHLWLVSEVGCSYWNES